MNKNDKYYLILMAIVVVLGIVLIWFMIATLIEARKTVEATQAQTYDLQCLTEPIEKPLEQCKEQ